MERPDVSIIIVNYNTPDYTDSAIGSVLDDSGSPSREVIVVDNASTDDSVARIKGRWGNDLRLIEHDRTVGFAAANNQAMREATGRYVLLLNSDAEMRGDAMAKMVRFADERPNVGVLGCRIVGVDGEQQVSCWRVYSLSYLLFRALNLYRWLPDGRCGCTNVESYGRPQETRGVEVVSGCAMLLRRSATERVGLFDEQFFMYCEDMDLCSRMHKARFDVFFLAEATALHRGGGTSADMLDRMSIEQGRSILKYMRKEHGLAAMFAANVCLGLFFLVRGPIWVIRSIAGGQRLHARTMVRCYGRSLMWHMLWPFTAH